MSQDTTNATPDELSALLSATPDARPGELHTIHGTAVLFHRIVWRGVPWSFTLNVVATTVVDGIGLY